ncbi:response regulator [Wenxinia marina]|nr:response regulator [Wenxinia marina]
MRLLYVEDEVLIALDTQDMLADMGFEDVTYVARRDKALQQAEEGEFGLALLDVNLGHGETSLEVAQTLRSRGIPVVFLTGYNSVELLDEFDWARIVEKPLAPPRLTEAIDATLGAAQERAQA